MIKGFHSTGLRALLAVIIAVAGFSGLMATASAQDAIDVTIEAGGSGVDVLPVGTELHIVNEAGDVVDGAGLGGESLPTSAPQRIPGVDGTYTIMLVGVDATTASVTVTGGVPEPAALTLTLLGDEPEPPVLEGPVWTSVRVELPDGAEGTVGMAWALDDTATGTRIAEGSDHVDLPQWLINEELDLGTYNLTLDPRPDYAPIQTQIVIDESTAQYHPTEGYWYAQFEFTLAAAPPQELAFIHLDVSSADPSVANTLPEGAMWVVYDNSGAGGGVIAEGAFTQLDLPVTVHLEDVPFGEMLIAIDGTPVFEPYERTHEIGENEQVLDIVLNPVTTDDDNGDDGQNGGDADDGKDQDHKGADKKDGDKKHGDNKDETVDSLPVVGSGPSGPDSTVLATTMAFIAAIVAAGVGLRLRRINA